MIKVTNRHITEALDALQALSHKPLPIRASVQVAKLAAALAGPIGVFNEVRNGLIEQYGDKGEDGQKTVIFPGNIQKLEPSENVSTFLEKVNELLDVEVEVDADQIELPAEVDGKPLVVEPFILVALDKFVKVA